MSYLRCTMLLMSCLALHAADVPTGQATAEGVACDLARSFIAADKSILNRIAMPSDKAEYQAFLSDISKQMDGQISLDAIKRSGPKDIGICFQMGRLSKNGPNSYASTAMNFVSIGFVDVGVMNYDGTRTVTRTFVCKRGDTWFALPRPELFPLLTSGLNEEPRPTGILYPAT